MLEKLRSEMSARKLEALWVSKPEHVRYLSGFSSPRDGKVLVTLRDAVLYTDGRYTMQAKQESRLETFISQQPGAARLTEMIRGGQARQRNDRRFRGG